MHVSVNVPPRDVELIEWIDRLRRDNVKVSAAVRRVLLAHIRVEETLTVEAIADAVVARMREEGLVIRSHITGRTQSQDVLIQDALDAACREFTVK